MRTRCCRMPCSSPPSAGRRRTSSTWRKRRLPSSTVRRPPRASSGRSETAIGIRAERKRRCTISSRSRPSRWPMPRWPRSICSATRNTWLPSAAPTAGFTAKTACEQPLVDVRCGACCDGLQASGVNRNQGAESTLAYLWTELNNAEVQHSLATPLRLRLPRGA